MQLLLVNSKSFAQEILLNQTPLICSRIKQVIYKIIFNTLGRHALECK